MSERLTVPMHRLEYEDKWYVRVEDVRGLLQAELLTTLDLEPMVSGESEECVVAGMKDVLMSLLNRTEIWESPREKLKSQLDVADTKPTTDPKDNDA